MTEKWGVPVLCHQQKHPICRYCIFLIIDFTMQENTSCCRATTILLQNLEIVEYDGIWFAGKNWYLVWETAQFYSRFTEHPHLQ